MTKLKKVILFICTGLCFASIVSAADQGFRYLPDDQVVELKPQMRPEPLTSTIYTLPTDYISPYLDNVLLFDNMDQYETLPYIVGFDRDNTIASANDIAYTKGINVDSDVSSYSLLEPGEELINPETGEKVGLQVFVIGSAELQKEGNPQTVLITDAKTTIDIGTRLTPSVGIDLPAIMDVKFADNQMKGYILSIAADSEGGGPYTPVVVSLGKRHGLKQGQVLSLKEGVREVKDPESFKQIELPKNKFGEVLIYKVADKISLGIITYATRVVVPNDIVTTEQGL